MWTRRWRHSSQTTLSLLPAVQLQPMVANYVTHPPNDALLLGTDVVKDEATLVRAYDDKAGGTAAFNLNVLHRLNRELGADFDTRSFRHRARWNRVKSRMEMHLESTRDQCANIPAAQLSVEFAAIETIHTERSYKFTRKTLGALLDDASFTIEQGWTDPRQWYTLTLASLQY